MVHARRSDLSVSTGISRMACDRIVIFYLVTRVCTTGILTTDVVSSSGTVALTSASSSSSLHNYLPALHGPKLFRDDAVQRVQGEDVAVTAKPRIAFENYSVGLSSGSADPVALPSLPSKDTGKWKLPIDVKRQPPNFLEAAWTLTASTTATPPVTTVRKRITNGGNEERRTITRARETSSVSRASTRHVTTKRPPLPSSQRPSKTYRRSSYRVVEQPDDFLRNNFYKDEGMEECLLCRERIHQWHSHHDSQHADITDAIRALDRFLSETLNDDSYNSELHPPPNPVLALVLSRYGHYVPGTRNPRVYSYAAANNIHNNKPFGRYRYGRGDEGQ